MFQNGDGREELSGPAGCGGDPRWSEMRCGDAVGVKDSCFNNAHKLAELFTFY